MSVLFIAVPAALAFTISAVLAFLWAARTGQLDDLDTPALRMLHDGTFESAAARRERAAGGGDGSKGDGSKGDGSKTEATARGEAQP